jgi:hypothetical protein
MVIRMNCIKKRTVFDLFEVYKCDKCNYHKKDEFIYIGNNIVGIYHLFNNCKYLILDVDYLIFDSKKLKILLKDAILNYENILLIFVEEFRIEPFYDIFSKILDSGLSIQIITF